MQERKNHLTFFLVSSEVELKEIQVSFSCIPAKPLETKVCKPSGHFQCPSNRHFFRTVTLAAHSGPMFGRMFCALGSTGSDGAGDPKCSLHQWPPTAQQHGWPPELHKDS